MNLRYRGHSWAQFGVGNRILLTYAMKRARTRSRCWFFTWDNAEDILPGTLLDNFQSVEYVFQKEKGEGGMIHYQGVIRFKNPVEGPGEDLFHLCHWERCRNWRQAIKYCSKLDSRIDGPWSNVKGLTWRKTIIDPLEGKVLYKWQRDILEMIDQEPDERKVYWYWDEDGCTGKTSLAKHICLKKRTKALYLQGCNKNVMYAVAKRLEEVDIEIAIFGLTRQDRQGCSYRSLETLKDGIGFSGKYESGMFLCSGMHVLVFANFPPDEEALSRDRWEIRHIK